MLVQGPTAGKWWRPDWNPSHLVISLYSCLKPTHLSEGVCDSPLVISSSKTRSLLMGLLWRNRWPRRSLGPLTFPGPSRNPAVRSLLGSSRLQLVGRRVCKHLQQEGWWEIHLVQWVTKASPAWPPMALVSSSLALIVTLGAVISAVEGAPLRGRCHGPGLPFRPTPSSSSVLTSGPVEGKIQVCCGWQGKRTRINGWPFRSPLLRIPTTCSWDSIWNLYKKEKWPLPRPTARGDCCLQSGPTLLWAYQ